MHNIRSILFWMLDSIQGNIVKKHLEDIRIKNETSIDNDDRLNTLLEYAKKNVDYYREINADQLYHFPVITKMDIKNNYTKFESHVFKNKKTHVMSTSGSTGTPFSIRQDLNKRKRTIADLIYFNALGGQYLGEKYMYIKAFPQKKSRMDKLKQNVIPIDILRLGEQELEEIKLKLIRDKKIRSVLAYASTYEQLAKKLLESADTQNKFNIRCLFSSSAVLSQKTKKQLTNIFGCPVIDRYSNQENGILAQTKNTDGVFFINQASYHIELLKLDSNEIADAGELGRIIVTDLFNFAMPMIRYDTGDLAISDDKDRYKLKTLRSIQGRRVDVIYDTQGNILTPHTWSVHMRKYKFLKQWQFIQEDKSKYVLKVNGAEGIYDSQDFDYTLRKILGEDADITIQFVNEIPTLASGKFKNTVCNYIPNEG